MSVKSVIIAGLTIFFCYTYAAAQMARHEIGIEAGPSYASIFGSATASKEKGRVGFLTGFTYQYNFPKFFSIRTGFSIEQKGAYNTLDFTDTAGNVYGTGSYTRNINYMSIPIIFRLSFGKKVKFFTHIGTYLGFIYDANVRILNPAGYPDVQGFDVNRFEVGGTLGLGVSFTLFKRLNLSIEARDNLSMYNIGSQQNVFKGDAFTNAIYGLVGISYNIGLRQK